MLEHESLSWFYPKQTGDRGRDRNARTIQLACLLFAIAVGLVAVLDTIARERVPPVLGMAVVGLVAAGIINHAGRAAWAARTTILALLLTAILLVFEAHDGFRSHAMLVFPGLLLIAVMLLDRASYLITAGTVLSAIVGLGIAEIHGLTGAIPGVRTSTSLDSIIYVDLTVLVFAVIGSRIARDVERNVFDLRATIDELSVTNRELRETATALRDSEERFRATFMNSADSFLIATLEEGTIVEINDAFEALYGYTREEAVGKTTLQLNLYARPADRTRALAEVRAKGQLREFETVMRKKSGETFIAALSTKAFMLGGKWHLAVAARDITEQKHAEAALRESEERFRRVFEEGPLGLAIVGKEYRFLKVNSALCQMVGYSEAELTQKTFAEITHPDDVVGDVELAERLFRHEVPFYRMQKRYVKKTGEIIWINLTASIIFDADGEPVHGLAMVEDITEAKHAQEEALARQKLESVGTLASGIAHDFNNLLGGVLAQADLALAELRAGSSPEEELMAIREVALRGSEVVRQLMIYAGKESEVFESVEVSRAVEQILGLVKVSVSKHAVLETDLGRDLPAVRGSAAQIQQIVMNLVINASEAMGDRDGVIRMTTMRLPVAEDGWKGLAKGDYVQLEVFDTGHGMSSETQAKVFDPFFTTKSEGRGLGLAAVHGIVRNLGGAIHCTSEPGKGTTFTIFLPCSVATADNSSYSTSGSREPASLSREFAVLVSSML
jgi:PAS domain S-box-containing protein